MNITGTKRAIVALGAGSLALAALLVWLLLAGPLTRTAGEAGAKTLTEYGVNDVRQIQVSNQHGDFTVRQEGGGFILHDLPAERVHIDYLYMLLEESAEVQYTDEVGAADDLAPYGLDNPAASVTIQYTDGESLQLLLGDEEPLAQGRYFMSTADCIVRTMKANRSVRFLLPVTGFIDYYIGPGSWSGSPLSVIQDITFSGTALDEPLVITAVNSDDEAEMRKASSFGVATHLVQSPGLHEINQTTCVDAFGSLLNLISEGVEGYNYSEDELAAFGFDEPYMQVDFTYTAEQDGPLLDMRLRVAEYEGGYIATVDGEGIVYHIRGDNAFLDLRYENAIMRWILTPFITDLSGLQLELGGEEYHFTFTGEDNQTLGVELNGEALDIEQFRTFYTLLISASWEGELLNSPTLPDTPEMAAVFTYRDGQKPPDTLRLFAGDDRKLLVEVNGTCEFSMREKYLATLTTALDALQKGESFSSEW